MEHKYITALHAVLCNAYSWHCHSWTGTRRSVVFEAPCYKQEGRGFETPWGNTMLSFYLILRTVLGPRVYLASNRNKYQGQK
jgi:hypothetical protein